MGGCCGKGEATVSPEPPPARSTSSKEESRQRKSDDKALQVTRRESGGYNFDADAQRYSKPLAIFSQLQERDDLGGLAPVRLLRVSWLLARADQAKQCRTSAERAAYALPRRQDLERLHPEAFYAASEVAEMAMQGAKASHYGPRQTAQLRIVSVSHCWERPNHPDPECRTLIELARAIRLAQTHRQVTYHGSRMQPLPEELAVFFDWCSLLQHDAGGNSKRTPVEDLAFRAALSRMQIWYAHQGTTAIFLTRARRDRSVTVRTLQYHQRGWPTFEYQVSMLAKPGSSAGRWPALIDTALINEADGTGGLAERLAPLTPERMQALLKKRAFTNGSDHEMVARLYRDTAENVIGHASALSYHGSMWDDEQLACFAEWLPRCHDLQSLHLGANEFGDAGIVALATAIVATSALNFEAKGDGGKVGAPAWGSGYFTSLFYGVNSLSPKGKSRPVCPALEYLRLHDNARISQVGANALASSLRKGALPALKQLSFPPEAVSTALRDVCSERGIEIKRGRSAAAAAAAGRAKPDPAKAGAHSDAILDAAYGTKAQGKKGVSTRVSTRPATANGAPGNAGRVSVSVRGRPGTVPNGGRASLPPLKAPPKLPQGRVTSGARPATADAKAPGPRLVPLSKPGYGTVRMIPMEGQ